MSRPSDTSIGGEKRVFPSTIWSDILAADPAQSHYQDRLDRLLRAYWKPVYAYIRASWRKPVEDAKDLTQAFFAHVLGKGYLARLRPDRGSFRGYLKQALKHFLIDAHRAESVRQPDGPLFSLEADPREMERLGPAAPDESPERAYDREWFRCVLDAAIEELRESLSSGKKKAYFEVFRLYCLDSAVSRDPGAAAPLAKGDLLAAPSYADVAKRLGLQEKTVRYYLFYCRGVLREILRRRIRDYLASDDEIDRELGQVLNG